MNELPGGKELTGGIGNPATEAMRDEGIHHLYENPGCREELRRNYEESGLTLISLPSVGAG